MSRSRADAAIGEPPRHQDTKNGSAMGSTYVRFRNREIRAHDGTLEQWMLHVIREVESRPRDPWLLQLRDDWLIAVESALPDPNLDHFLTDEDRLKQMLDILNCTLSKLRQLSDTFSNEQWYELLKQKMPWEAADLPGSSLVPVRKAGEQMIELLQKQKT